MAERRAYSLAARLALVTALWSACALLVTGTILTNLFRHDAERSFDIRIEADLVNLVRDAASRRASDSALPVDPLGPFFREPFSGWAWQVRLGDTVLAQSGSLGPLAAGVAEPLRPPGREPADFIAPGGIASRGAAREVHLRGETGPLTFAVARPRAEIDDSLSYFSTLLLYSLAVFGAVMFVASLVLTRIMLAPVTRLEAAVRQMRDGNAAPLEGNWPREIVPVINALGELNAHVARLIDRSRNQASDLAHALKTPLSIIRQTVEKDAPQLVASVTGQLDRIDRSLDWHLTRRRLAGSRYGRVSVEKAAEEILFAMSRLFEERGLVLRARVEPGTEFAGDDEDLHEMLGNLTENACKWAGKTVVVTAETSGSDLTIRVDDDGPGIPGRVAEAVFGRGTRLDETAPGHGHGLAIVRDIAAAYGGVVRIGDSSMGGASVRVVLPGSASPHPGRAAA